MTSYLRGWFSPGISSDVVSTVTHNSPPPPPSLPLDEDDEGSTTETEGDRDNNDIPPAFPSLDSAQRVRITTTDALDQGSRRLTDAQMMPPPPSIPLTSMHRTGPGSLTVPLSTVKRPSKKQEKVVLAPGHSPMDWANLKISGQDLRVCFILFFLIKHKMIIFLFFHIDTSKGVPTLLRVTPSMLKQHNTRQDAWTAINGKVYNVTPYLAFHPGGEKELMRVAGRDGTKLFGMSCEQLSQFRWILIVNLMFF